MYLVTRALYVRSLKHNVIHYNCQNTVKKENEVLMEQYLQCSFNRLWRRTVFLPAQSAVDKFLFYCQICESFVRFYARAGVSQTLLKWGSIHKTFYHRLNKFLYVKWRLNFK